MIPTRKHSITFHLVILFGHRRVLGWATRTDRYGNLLRRGSPEPHHRRRARRELSARRSGASDRTWGATASRRGPGRQWMQPAVAEARRNLRESERGGAAARSLAYFVSTVFTGREGERRKYCAIRNAAAATSRLARLRRVHPTPRIKNLFAPGLGEARSRRTGSRTTGFFRPPPGTSGASS